MLSLSASSLAASTLSRNMMILFVAAISSRSGNELPEAVVSVVSSQGHSCHQIQARWTRNLIRGRPNFTGKDRIERID